jgi:hypothetical protein
VGGGCIPGDPCWDGRVFDLLHTPGRLGFLQAEPFVGPAQSRIDGHVGIEKNRHSESGVFLWLRKGGYVWKKSLEVGESWAKYFEMYK